MFRCLDCFHQGVFCHVCCLETHQWQPFHCVEEWTGSYFKPVTLFDLGLLLHLGHKGDRCPSATDASHSASTSHINDDDSEDTKLTVVDKGGVQVHRIRWCACRHSPDHHIQLLQMGLYPATIDNPRTVFTFRCLRYFHIDSMECRTSALNFYTKLKRLTNDTFPNKVPVSGLKPRDNVLGSYISHSQDRYCELMTASRQWRDLQLRKTFGFGHNRGQQPKAGELAHFCPACPQPGINLPKDWQKQKDQ
jgi:CxC2 like cysteine cluster associated with KDZ transposases